MMTIQLKYGDHLLANYSSVKVIEDGVRGRNIPDETALTELQPRDFLNPGEACIPGTYVQKRALDETGPFFAPWGRDLMWRMLNEGVPETLDKTRCYIFAGDRDLQYSDGSAVMLFIHFREGMWRWCDGSVYDIWHVRGQLLALDVR